MPYMLVSGDNHIDLTYCPPDLWSSQAPAKWKLLSRVWNNWTMAALVRGGARQGHVEWDRARIFEIPEGHVCAH